MLHGQKIRSGKVTSSVSVLHILTAGTHTLYTWCIKLTQPDGLQIRDSIKALFPDRDCFPLVRPMSDEKALAKLETLNSSEMRPEFQQVK